MHALQRLTVVRAFPTCLLLLGVGSDQLASLENSPGSSPRKAAIARTVANLPFDYVSMALQETRKESRATEYSSKHAYELRLYGMEPQNFGQALRTRTVKAPQCLTSIQFSPTSRYLIVAYGR